MLDNEFHISTDSRASLVSLVCPKLKEHGNKFDTQRSLNELRELLRTLGLEYSGEYVQNKQSVDLEQFSAAASLKRLPRRPRR